MVEFTLEHAADRGGGLRRAVPARRSAPRSVVAGEDFRFGHRRRGDLDLLRGLGFEVRTGAAARGRVLVGRSATCSTRARSDAAARAARPAARGRGDGRRGRRARRARSASRPRTSPPTRRCSCRCTASTRASHGGHQGAAISIGDEPALRRRRAADRGLPARLRRRSLRQAAGRRALAAPPRRAGVRQRAGADRPDRPRRRGDRAGRAARLVVAAQLQSRAGRKRRGALHVTSATVDRRDCPQCRSAADRQPGRRAATRLTPPK